MERKKDYLTEARDLILEPITVARQLRLFATSISEENLTKIESAVFILSPFIIGGVMTIIAGDVNLAKGLTSGATAWALESIMLRGMRPYIFRDQ